MVKYEGESCINDQVVHNKKNQVVRDCTDIQENNNILKTLEKMVAKDIKERISNSLKVFSIWINKKTRKEILNNYHSV